ncbi:glycosyltransferase family 2 protein [Sphingomonas sp. BN140010]|uniref:Glycosyltransferase family 2 protein n=1 Tax=Sphingomonas arvum TaxID=2992113 RepID=A0ABT3JI62_9SPHN|nr:glycosyltransferase family 2 protein [Sphingomonas sp. BN140010]MCW3798763.1 glycosyltransferase family 2 protein [Sphingomonas sp. BN140010]
MTPAPIASAAGGEPLVSIVLPAYNAEAHISSAVGSVLAQSIPDWELLVIDDGSTDATLKLAEWEAERDRRVQVHRMNRNSGVSAARNRAFEMARGRWIAILDSDDLMAPDRLERLVTLGERYGADMVSDNIVEFTCPDSPLHKFFKLHGDLTIDAEHYLRHTMFFHGSLHYGLLKPLFRAEAVRRTAQRYDERLRLAEDDDFYLRLLLEGLTLRVCASPFYFYRQHRDASTQQITAKDVSALAEASDRLLADFTSHPLRALLIQRYRAFQRASNYLRLVESLRSKDIMGAISIAARWPSSLPLLRTPIQTMLNRVLGRVEEPAEDAELRGLLHETLRLAGEPAEACSPADTDNPLQLRPIDRKNDQGNEPAL